MENEKKITIDTNNTNNKGGARIGAGRKKTLPDGTKPVYFALTEDEKVTVRDFVARLRHGKEKMLTQQALIEETESRIAGIARVNLKRFVRQIIDLYGGRGKGFTKGEEFAKFVGITAFKSAVADWEADNGKPYKKRQ